MIQLVTGTRGDARELPQGVPPVPGPGDEWPRDLPKRVFAVDVLLTLVAM